MAVAVFAGFWYLSNSDVIKKDVIFDPVGFNAGSYYELTQSFVREATYADVNVEEHVGRYYWKDGLEFDEGDEMGTATVLITKNEGEASLVLEDVRRDFINKLDNPEIESIKMRSDDIDSLYFIDQKYIDGQFVDSGHYFWKYKNLIIIVEDVTGNTDDLIEGYYWPFYSSGNEASR